MGRSHRTGDSDDERSDVVVDLTDDAVESIARVIDLRAPGAPYTYPSSPTPPDPEQETREPTPSDAGMFGVARGSAHVPTAPPES